jgi:uncharacterized Zn-finger protein
MQKDQVTEFAQDAKQFNYFSFSSFLSLSFKSGDKPHACELCNKRFALACNLRAHIKVCFRNFSEFC